LRKLINKLVVLYLRVRIDVSRIQSAAIASKFQAAHTSSEKTRLAGLFDKEMRRGRAMQMRLDALEDCGQGEMREAAAAKDA